MESTAAVAQPRRKEFMGHPVGLYYLFFTELWERFSYYGMRAILVLYITKSATETNPGLGWENGSALALYGWYTMMVYVMSIPGGILADKFIGQKKSVFYGGLVLVAGHFILAFHSIYAFYTGLALIVLGVGGLKPNISTMVGGLYREGDERRDKGFTIFYIGINVGAALASLIVGYVGETINWHYGFGLAGFGMLLGQIVFMSGQKHLQGVGDPPSKRKDEENPSAPLGVLFTKLFRERTPLIVFLCFEVFSFYILFAQSLGYGLLFVFLSLVVGLMMVIYNELNSVEKDRYIVLLLSFIIVIVFWGAFEQAGGLMNLYTVEKINRFVNLGFWSGTIPASTFQSVNSIFIMIFGIAVANFWIRRRHKGKESSSLYKMAIGTIVMGLGFLFMGAASVQVMSMGKAAMIWLILAYLFQTLGELSSSPVALSFITKLAPARYASIMMGVYFAATGLGNKVAGVVGEASQTAPIKTKIETTYDGVTQFVPDSSMQHASNFTIKGLAYLENGQLKLRDSSNTESIAPVLDLSTADSTKLSNDLKDADATPNNKQHISITFSNPKDYDTYQKTHNVVVDLKNYNGEIEVMEIANKRELKTFILITVFVSAFGLLLLLFLKKLKKLTHGVEESERNMMIDEEEAAVEGH